MMENIVVYKKKPVLKNPIFIECLPGIGDVGKIAGDFIADGLGAEKFADIYSMHFPPIVIPDEDSIVTMASNELWYHSKDGLDIIFLRGVYQGSTAEGQFDLARDIMNILLEYKVSKIITLGGYGIGEILESPKVIGVVSDKKIKSQFKKHGVVFRPGEPDRGIYGASGLLLGLGKVYGIPSICLIGETSGYIIDYKSAREIVKVLLKDLGIVLPMEDIDDKSDKVDEFTSKVKEMENSGQKEEINYIG